MFFKRLSVLFALVLVTLFSCAQNNGPVVPTGAPQLFGGKYYQFSNYVRIDSALMLSARDTFVRPTHPAVIYKASDSTLYFWNKRKWAKIGAGVSVEVDPTVGAHIKALTTTDTSNFKTAYRKRPVSMVFDSLGRRLNLTLGDGTVLSDTIQIVGRDNWGTQVATTDETIFGNGLAFTPLRVDTNRIATRGRVSKVIDSLTAIIDTLNFYRLGDSMYVQWNDGRGWQTLSVIDSVGPAAEFFDEGASVGVFNKVNFVGSGVTTTVAGDRLDVNVTGGGGGGADGNNYPTSVILNSSGVFTLSRFGLTDLVENFNTSKIPEGVNEYFTISRARSSISAAAPVLYNSTTGVVSADTSLAAASLTTYGRLRKIVDSLALTFPASTNIYNSNGTLTGNRTVNTGSFRLDFTKDIYANNVRIGQGNKSTLSPLDNTVFGEGTLENNTTGYQNTMVGSYAGWGVTGGGENTFVGAYIGSGPPHSSSASRNTAIGSQAMVYLTSGDDNNAFGSASLYALTSGVNNTVVGSYGLTALTTGSYNTAIGTNAGAYYNNGSYNTFIGEQSALTNTGSGNVFLGYNTGAFGFDTVSNRLIIHNNTDADPLIYGSFIMDTIRFNGAVSIRDMIADEAGTKLMLWDSITGKVKWRSVSGLGGGGGGGATLYSGDGTLSGLRTVNGNGNELLFVNLKSFVIEDNTFITNYPKLYRDGYYTTIGEVGKNYQKTLKYPYGVSEGYGAEIRHQAYNGESGSDYIAYSQQAISGEDVLGRYAGGSTMQRVLARKADTTVFQAEYYNEWSFGDNGVSYNMYADSSKADLYMTKYDATNTLQVYLPNPTESFAQRTMPISVNGVYANASGNINLGNGPTYNFIYNVDNVDVTVSSWDATIIIRNHTTTRTVTLPTAASSVGRVLEIVNAGTGTITTTIAMRKNDSVTVTSIPADTTYRIQSDGSSWFILGVMSR